MESLATFLSLAGLFGLAYGMFRPAGALPRALGRPSRKKVAGVYLGVMVLAGAIMPTEASGAAEVSADASGGQPGWDEAATARARVTADSLVAAWEGALEAAPDSGSAYVVAEAVDAEAEAVALAAGVDPAAAEPLRELATRSRARGRELGMLARARAIPARDLERNRRAYDELARAFPAVPLYASKRADYDRRIRERAARPVRRAAPRRSASRSSGACCKRCGNSQPCGNSCISWSYTCRQPPGCAC